MRAKYDHEHKLQLKTYITKEERAMLDELVEQDDTSISAIIGELITRQWKQMRSAYRRGHELP